MMLEDEDIEAVISLSGVKPVMVDYVNTARVTLPVIREVLTPTILETELGFLRELIVNRIYCTDLPAVIARFMVATYDVREQLDMLTPVVEQVQTAVDEVSQVLVVSVGRVIFRTSPLLYTNPLGSLTVAVIVVLIPTVVIVESMK